MLDIASLNNLLAQPQKIVITTHHKPDGDAMGSSLGLYNYLIQQGHHTTVITPTDYPDFLAWMPGNEEVMIYHYFIGRRGTYQLAHFINAAQVIKV